MSIVETMILEINSFEKLQGKKPKYLILSGLITDKFFSEIAQYILRTEGAVFENPKEGHIQFMGVTVVKNVVTYGGSFNFSLGV